MSAASTILEIPEMRARVSPVAVAQYQQFPEFNENGRRTELIRGVIIEKISKSPLHSSIARRLFKMLQTSLPAEFTLLRKDPLVFADSVPEPDLAIVRGDEQTFSNQHPTTAALVIEIAVSSIAEDRSLTTLYAEAGVEEYWIVQPVEHRVEIYRRPERGAYLDRITVDGTAILQCVSLPFVRVNLDELFG
jgi:Uma2 family endonuclease